MFTFHVTAVTASSYVKEGTTKYIVSVSVKESSEPLTLFCGKDLSNVQAKADAIGKNPTVNMKLQEGFWQLCGENRGTDITEFLAQQVQSTK